MLIIKRTLAVAIACTLFVMFWGGFLLAEGDAYAPGHRGYIHSPLGILCYAGAVILGMPCIALIMKLWDKPVMTDDGE